MYFGKEDELMGYNVLDVCRHVINYSNENDYGISNLKLQKVLYFIQAYFVTNKKDHAPCFDEKIEAWDFGPVVPEAYHEYKQYGSGDIPSISYIYLNVDYMVFLEVLLFSEILSLSALLPSSLLHRRFQQLL